MAPTEVHEPPTVTLQDTPQSCDAKTLAKLHKLIDGKQGKYVALVIKCAAEQGLITQMDYKTVTGEFGDIGSRENYNHYFRGYQFDPIEIEAVKKALEG